MAETKMIRRAKVILKGAKSYKLGGKTYKKDVPEIVKGDKIDELQNNAYFSCREIAPVEAKKKKKKSSEGGSSKKSSKKKTSKKKASKKTSKKASKKKSKKS